MTDPVALLEELLRSEMEKWSHAYPRDKEIAQLALTTFCAKLKPAIALMRAPVGDVSDAMLERALDAMRQGQYEGDQFRDSMRRALRSAMQQTTKEGGE